jgi:hypothetical protein
MPLPVTLDHLVIAAHSLAQGVQWCEALLGITPGPGGTHTKMGTHNRLFSIAGPSAPGVYAEIIAIDPEAPALQRRRWFGLDEPTVQTALSCAPQWVHVVVRAPQLPAHVAALRALGLDPGQVVAMSRATAQGELHWQLTVRDDGRLPHDGCLPTLIEWPDGSPGTRLPASGVQLTELALIAPAGSSLPAAYSAIHWQPAPPRVPAADKRHRWRATLQTPRGEVCLSSF